MNTDTVSLLDSIHRPVHCPSGVRRCHVCITGVWPCRTHLILHPPIKRVDTAESEEAEQW